MRLTKTATYLIGAGKMAILAGAPMLALPSTAMAEATTSKTVIGEATKRTHGDANQTLSTSTLNDKVNAVAAWLIGLAVSLFILKVVLTGVDRMLLADKDGSSFLSRIPIIGAYPQPNPNGDQNGKKGYTWKDVWINLAIQLLIAVSAWVLMQIIVQFLLAAFVSAESGAKTS